jgi:hypothetical protein
LQRLAKSPQNPWGAHFCTKYGYSPIPFKAKVVRRTNDHVDQKLAEAIEIAETSPPINTDSGWRLLHTIRKRSLAERTHVQEL